MLAATETELRRNDGHGVSLADQWQRQDLPLRHEHRGLLGRRLQERLGRLYVGEIGVPRRRRAGAGIADLLVLDDERPSAVTSCQPGLNPPRYRRSLGPWNLKSLGERLALMHQVFSYIYSRTSPSDRGTRTQPAA